MKDPDKQKRFDELDAARALGDLSSEEHEELAHFIQDGFESDQDLDWMVAGLETLGSGSPEKINPSLESRLLDGAEPLATTESTTDRKITPFWRHPILGWAAAACLTVAFLLSNREAPLPSPADARLALLNQESAVQLPFSGTGDFASLSGDVVWKDETQSGYLSFNGLKPNNPTEQQYQLWIVDPKRDTAPVDGGVFDIPNSKGPIVIPIRAALQVSQPVAFVVTVEKPGGVVVSKQEIVAAIAQRG